MNRYRYVWVRLESGQTVHVTVERSSVLTNDITAAQERATATYGVPAITGWPA